MKDLAALVLQERRIGHAPCDGRALAADLVVDVAAEDPDGRRPAFAMAAKRSADVARRRQVDWQRALQKGDVVAALELLEGERLFEVADRQQERPDAVSQGQVLNRLLTVGRIRLKAERPTLVITEAELSPGTPHSSSPERCLVELGPLSLA